jgi:ketosteroid isomerase-like protein
VTIDRNKALIRDFFARMNAADLPGALAMLDASATWRIPGDPAVLRTAGVHDTASITKLLTYMQSRMPGGLHFTVSSLTAEGDRVSAEVEGEGTLDNGRRYNNWYHFLFTLRDGRIHEVHEYLDTQLVVSAWLTP